MIKIKKILLIVFVILMFACFVAMFASAVANLALMNSNVQKAIETDSSLVVDELRRNITINSVKLFLGSFYFFIASCVSCFSYKHIENNYSRKKSLAFSIVNIIIGCLPVGIILLVEWIQTRRK